MKLPWYIHPIFILVISLVALTSSFVIYLRSYLSANNSFLSLVRKYNIRVEQINLSESWMVILSLSLLLGIILLGLVLIFIFNQKMISLVNQQKNFINGFTHELKTPITSLQLYIQTCLKHKLSQEDYQKYLGYMLKDTSRIKKNVEKILRLAQVEDEKIRPHLTQVNVRHWPSKIMEVLKKDYPSAQFILEEKRLSGHLLIDESWAHILFNNLVENSLKYSDPQEVTRIKLIASCERSTLLLVYEDNGVGVAPSEEKKIFKKFYQVGSSDNMTAKGMGVGLYFAKLIVKAHKGKITAHSLFPQKGIKFKIRFPLH